MILVNILLQSLNYNKWIGIPGYEDDELSLHTDIFLNSVAVIDVIEWIILWKIFITKCFQNVKQN